MTYIYGQVVPGLPPIISQSLQQPKSGRPSSHPMWRSRMAMQQEAFQSPSSCLDENNLFNDPSTADTYALYNQTSRWQLLEFSLAGTSISKTWFFDGQPLNTTGYLVSVPITLPSDSRLSFFFSFYHRYDMERGYDGCLVYYTTNQGQTWHDMGSLFSQNGYNFELFSQQGTRQAFSGTTTSFNETIADLTTLRGNTISFAFIAMTDFSIPSVGWWVNRIKLWSAECNGTAQPTQTASQTQTPSQSSSTSTTNNSSASGVAAAALIISIITAIFVLVVTILACHSYYKWKNSKALKKKEVPMVNIVTHENAPPSPRS